MLLSGQVGIEARTAVQNHLLICAPMTTAGRLWVAGAGDILQTISEGTGLADGSEHTGLYADGQEFVAYGVKAILEISHKWGINASSFTAGQRQPGAQIRAVYGGRILEVVARNPSVW